MDDIAARWLGARFTALEDGTFDREVRRLRTELDTLPSGDDPASLVDRGTRIGAVVPAVWDQGSTLRALASTGLRSPVDRARRPVWSALEAALDRSEREWLRAVAALPADARAEVMDHPQLADLRPRLDFELAAVEPADHRERLAPAGPALWAGIASGLERSFRAEIGGREVGAAVADGFARAHPDASIRQAAATARDDHRGAWKDLWADAIDARVVWLTLRSPEEAVASAFRDGRVGWETWRALDGAWLRRGTELGRQAVALRSEIAGIDCALPWNRLAPPPLDSDAALSVDDALTTIRAAFAAVGPELAASVDEVHDRGWIESGTRPCKSSGAWMHPFVAPIEPRIALSWGGTPLDALILAHELGHAHHLMAMRGLPFGRVYFPNSLAELASVFAEHLYRRHAPAGPAARYVASQFDRYLTAIPAALRFELRLLEDRGERPWTSDRLTDLWVSTATEVGIEVLPNGWCSPGFLGPRTLASLGHVVGAASSQLVVRSFEREPAGFDVRLRALLRDTGTLEVGALVARHLDVDVTRPEAWDAALETFAEVVDGPRPPPTTP